MKKQPKPIMTVRIEPDVEKQVRRRKDLNGRTVQGEVNTTLRRAYAGPRDYPSKTCVELYDDVVARRKEMKDMVIRTKIPLRLKMAPHL